MADLSEMCHTRTNRKAGSEGGPTDSLTRSQIKRMKRKEKKRRKEEEKIKHEEVNQLQEDVLEVVEDLKLEQMSGTADILLEKVKVTEVIVLDCQGKPERGDMSQDDENALREFLKTLHIADSNKAIYENINFHNQNPVISIPEEIFEEFIESEEINQTKEAIKSIGVVPKLSPKSKKKEMSPKFIAKIIDPVPKVLYSYSGAPIHSISTVSIVTMDDLEDGLVVVNKGDDVGFKPLDIILEESGECSDTSSDKKSIAESKISKETAKIYPLHRTFFPKINITQAVTETMQNGVEVVCLEEEDDEIIAFNGLNVDSIKFIEDDSGSSGYGNDDYEADVESALESQRDTIILDGQDADTALEDSNIEERLEITKKDDDNNEWQSVWINNEIHKELSEVSSNVDVKALKNELADEINPILASKLMVMEIFDDPVLKETSWGKILKRTKESLAEKKRVSDKEVQTVRNPASLIKLAKKALMDLPNGPQVAHHIGLSLSCPSSPPEIPKFCNRRVSDTETCSEILFYNAIPDSKSTIEPESQIPFQKNVDNVWYGMPTYDPSLYLELSYSQVEAFGKTQKHAIPTKEEAENLLDLHQKFIERRSYNDETFKTRNLVFDSTHLMNERASNVGVKKDRDTITNEDESEKINIGDAKIKDGMATSATFRGPTAKSILLAHFQNATDGELVSHPKLNTSAGREVFDMEHAVIQQNKQSWITSEHKAEEHVTKTTSQVQHGVGRTVLDKFMNDSSIPSQDEDRRTENRFLAGFQNSKLETPEESIVIDKTPSVSQIIKSFESPNDAPDAKKCKRDEDVITKNDKRGDFISDNYVISKKRDIAVIQSENRRKSLTDEESFKQQMYDEYMSKLAERVERRQQNSIKISSQNEMEDGRTLGAQGVEEEFLSKARERQARSKSDEVPVADTTSWTVKVEDEKEHSPSSKRSSVVLCADTNMADLPKHLQEFLGLTNEQIAEMTDRRRKRLNSKNNLLKEIDEALIYSKGFLLQRGERMFNPTFKARAPRPGVWSPLQPSSQTQEVTTPALPPDPETEEKRTKIEEEPIPPVWTPKSAQASPVAERKEFRSINFESPTLPRKKFIQEEPRDVIPPWEQKGGEKPLEIKSSSTSNVLPRAPNPTVTLLQKAREGQIPRGAQYLNSTMPDQDEHEYHENEIYFPSKNDPDRSLRIELGPRKPVSGIGPTTKEGIPLVLRSEVTEENKEKWYKRMYDSLHRPGSDDDYVTVKYRSTPNKRALHGYHSASGGGYQSEPEPLASDDIGTKYATLDRRRIQKNKENEIINVTLPRKGFTRFGSEPYKVQPGRIENYQPGHSSISDIEANKWWDEVLEIFDRWLEANPGADGRGARRLLADAIYRRQAEKSQPVHKTHSPKSFMTYALKESGYESDPQHIFKRRDDEFQTPLSPQEQKEAYKTIQKGGEVPLRGLRKPAPERPKEETEIEYFPLSPTLTRIRVHKQNITPLSGFPFPFANVQYPVYPVGVCSSYSQIQLYPQNPCTKQGNLYQFSQNLNDGCGDQHIKLQNIAGDCKIVPKPRTLPKKSPLYENLHNPSRSPSPKTRPKTDPIQLNKDIVETTQYATFADLKRTTPSLIPQSINRKTKEKVSKSRPTPKTRYLSLSKGVRSKQKVPLSESSIREKPLSKVQKRLKTISGANKRRLDSKTSPKNRTESEIGEHLSKFIESELGPGYLSHLSGDDPATDSSSIEKQDNMNPVYDATNPHFSARREADFPPFRSRSFSPEAGGRPKRPPSPPLRESSRNSSTLRLWSEMMVTYPCHRSRLDVYDSNIKYLQDKLRKKLDGTGHDYKFADDVETVRSVRKNRNGEMTIKTNKYVKLTRPSSVGPTFKTTYDQNGRRVVSETRKTSTDTKGADSKKSTPRKSDTYLKTTYSLRNGIEQDDDKQKSVKVTVAISSKGKEATKKLGQSATSKKTSVKASSPSPSVSSYRSGISARSCPSEKGSSSPGRVISPRVLSPNSTISRISSASRTSSPIVSGSDNKPKKGETKKTTSSIKSPVTITKEPKKLSKPSTITKSPGKKILSQISNITKSNGSKGNTKRNGKIEGKKKISSDNEKKTKASTPNLQEEIKMAEQGQQVRTDKFFQNLFLREPIEKKPTIVERSSSVMERARRYQRSIQRPDDLSKGEPNAINLLRFYLTQKRPVSSSKFKALDRELSASRSPSPCGRSQSFQSKLRRFDSGSQFGDDLISFSPDLRLRSSSEPPARSSTGSPEERRSPRQLSPSSSYWSTRSYKPLELIRSTRKRGVRARSAGEVENAREQSTIASSAQSTSTLHLSENPEYQAYILELLHSGKKSERFRELHKFYVSLERMAELEKTTSVTDLRPRLKNEEIIDFDRWKRLRSKERAEAELKTLVDKLTEIQKEKDLVFRTADVEAVRWKGDRGLRAKERSVDDLKEQFLRFAHEESIGIRRDVSVPRDNYKPLWRGESIFNVASNLNTTMASHRGRPVTRHELKEIEFANQELIRSAKHSRKYSSLSNEQVSVLKSQLSEIYTQELKRKGIADSINPYEISVPEDLSVKAPGEEPLYVRCNSLLTKEETMEPVIFKNDEKKKGRSISSMPLAIESDDSKTVTVLPLPWKNDCAEKSIKKTSKPKNRSSMSKTKSTTKVLSEGDKKRISQSLSQEVLEKIIKQPKKSPVLARETLGAVASSRHRRRSPDTSTVGSPRTCYSLDTLDDGKCKNDFLLVLTPTEDVEKAVKEWANGNPVREENGRVAVGSTATAAELESVSVSSETSVKTVITNPVDVLKKVEYYEDLTHVEEDKKEQQTKSESHKSEKSALTPSFSLENIQELFGEEKKYTTCPMRPKTPNIEDLSQKKKDKCEDFLNLRNIFEDRSSRYRSASPYDYPRYADSADSLFSLRSRSISPDPTKYYRAYLRMVRGGAVQKLCSRFESVEDLSSDRDCGWLTSPVKKSASDPELTRDMLRRYGTDPSRVVVRGQEIGDVQFLRTKYEEKDSNRGRSRTRRSPIPRTPFSVSDRHMPRINVISKTAELQLQKLHKQPKRFGELPASPEPFHSLTEYTRDHGGYYYVGEVEKLKRKFEKLEEQERMSLLGQMYTSTPEVNELRDIAPYLGCDWVAHQHPEVIKATSSSPELVIKRKSSPHPFQYKQRPHSSSPIRPKQLPSILKNYPSGDVFANQKFDPTIHRPKYRYQPEPVTYSYDRRLRWPGDTDSWWRQWSRPTVTFKDLCNLIPELSFPEEIIESPRKYVESEVTIHYKSPVRSEAKVALSEEELARRQAEAMRRIYQEERRRKYLQELQDMNSRRHTDNFTPSQKSPIPLNRYDDFPADHSPSYIRDRTPEPRLIAKALFTFVGQSARELSFRRGDIIHVRRQIDRNWCEGELNNRIGLFPVNYTEMMPQDCGLRTTPSKPNEGQARAKFNFIAQSHLELSLVKGELVVLTRRVDENWYEGRVGTRRGIFPVSYVEVLVPPGVGRTQTKPVASPAAHSLLLNGGSAQQSMGPHHYTPLLSPNFTSRPNQALHIDTQTEPLLYRVLYSYKPVNADELELVEGDTVLVMEKCDDGWYVGSSQKTGQFGTFPGNYVQRI